METRDPTVWLLGLQEFKWLAFVNLVFPWTSVCSQQEGSSGNATEESDCFLWSLTVLTPSF